METVLIPDVLGFILRLVLTFINLLEDILEASIILLQDCVLCAHVQRPFLVKSIFEAAVCKISDGLVCVVHGQGHATSALKVKHCVLDGLSTILGGKADLQLALAWYYKVC